MKISSLMFRSFVLAAISLPYVVGCGSSSTPTANKSVNQETTTPATPPGTLVEDGASTQPAQTVAIFLDSLRKGDERAANSVLTSLARQELSKSSYVMQPLGTPAGKYSIGRVSFPYADNPTVSLVECTWTEPALDNQPSESMDIVCEVHQETEGWRISGIGVTIPGTDQALVLDFEDATSLQATIDAATGQTSPPQPATQVATGQMTSQVGLPTFPAGAGSPPANPQPSYPEIALPQFNNAPINR